jgi:ADP-ribose pyrophosphatase YjhB (NUDIX family)
VLHLIERLLPVALHRAGLRVAHALRRVIRRVFKPQLVGVALLATSPDGKVLLVRHSYGSNKWALPGGAVNRGEEPAAAARRELREELGCDAEHLDFVAALDGQLSGAPHSDHVFHVILDRTPRPDGRELTHAKFFPLDALPVDIGSRAVRQIAAWRDGGA